VSGRDAGQRVDKPWGHELIWAHTDRYVGKVLVIEAGKRLSLQRHEVKDESIIVTSGRLRLYLEDDAGVVQVEELVAGDHRHVRTGRVHRYEAIERTELMEVSTPELDDVVRLEDDFGREGTSAPKINYSAFFREAFEKSRLTDDQEAALKWLIAQPKGPARMLVISEDWCIDSQSAVPVVSALADAASNLSLRRFLLNPQSRILNP